MSKYGERVKAARTYAGLTQPQLSEKLGGKITQQGISYLEAGEAYGSEFTVQIANICKVDATWLATGEGFMTSGDDRIAIEIARGLTAQQRRAWYRAGRALAEPDEGTNDK
jgi:transcriptional regulator with XRE-family HTH domain